MPFQVLLGILNNLTALVRQKMPELAPTSADEFPHPTVMTLIADLVEHRQRIILARHPFGRGQFPQHCTASVARQKEEAGQHFADLRFFPTVPRWRTLSM